MEQIVSMVRLLARKCLTNPYTATKWAATCQNQQNECAPSEDSDQPGHPPSLIRVFAVRMKTSWVLSYPLSAQRRLWSDWADAQADLSLCWEHTHFVGFVMSWLKWWLWPPHILSFKYHKNLSTGRCTDVNCADLDQLLLFRVFTVCNFLHLLGLLKCFNFTIIVVVISEVPLFIVWL